MKAQIIRWLVALPVFGACQSYTAVTARQFDQSCQGPDDCVAVLELEVTGSNCVHHCPTSAIAKAAQQAFDAAVQAAGSKCTMVAMPGCAVGGPLTCVNHVCGIGSLSAADVSGD